MNNAILDVLSETLSDIILATDVKSKITYCSGAIESMLGYTPEEVVGNNLTMIMPERFREMHQIGMSRYVATGQRTLDWKAVEAVGLRKDGTELPLEISFGDYQGEDGERYFTGVIRDITVRKQLEARSQLEKEELERINNELEQFGYAVSHDLQEPIRAIYSYAELVRKKEELSSTTDIYIKNIEDNARRLEAFVKTLLKHAQAGRVVDETVLNTNDVIASVIADLQSAIKESGATITYDSMLNVAVDSTNLRQIFQNLLENSIKFRKAGVKPQIQIVSKLLYNYVQFVVIDKGIGMPDGLKDTIFTTFQRLPTKGEYKGTGLGLAIVKKIVETYTGRIGVESEEGVGTTIYFTLPKGNL